MNGNVRVDESDVFCTSRFGSAVSRKRRSPGNRAGLQNFVSTLRRNRGTVIGAAVIDDNQLPSTFRQIARKQRVEALAQSCAGVVRWNYNGQRKRLGRFAHNLRPMERIALPAALSIT
jgi:hypothetical protein